MSNDISNVTRLSFTSSQKIDSTVSRVKDFKDKSVEQAQGNAASVSVAGSEKDHKAGDKKPENLISFEDAKILAEEGNKVLAEVQRNLQFKVDDETNRVVVSVVDRKSGEVLRQIPSDEILALAKRLKDLDGKQEHGVFFMERA